MGSLLLLKGINTFLFINFLELQSSSSDEEDSIVAVILEKKNDNIFIKLTGTKGDLRLHKNTFCNLYPQYNLLNNDKKLYKILSVS